MSDLLKTEDETLSIGKVAGETGLPVSTIRYYEKEFSGFLHLKKTSGGHRRFMPADVEKLKRIHGLVHGHGLSLKEAKTKLVSDRDPAMMRRDLDLLLEVFETLISEHVKIHKALESLSARLAALEQSPGKKKFRLF